MNSIMKMTETATVVCVGSFWLAADSVAAGMAFALIICPMH
jgi:hypothetical protein